MAKIHKRTPAAAAQAFKIRPAVPADVEAISALDLRETGIAKHAHWRELIERHARPRAVDRFFLVAVSTDSPARLIGFIVGEMRAWEFGSEPCGWVYAIGVDPDTRLQRVGEALLEAITVEFRAAGITKMRTMVARDNRLPMLFFRGEGMMAGPYIQLEKDLV
jgi:ribosomal protein S18 acetylase RimI-like enzyme